MTFTDWAGVVALVGAIVVLAWLGPRPRGVPRDAMVFPGVLPLEGAELLGAASARVAVIEFSDFSCPYSARFARETLPALKKRYVDSGNVLWAFRHYPLTELHSFAQQLAVAATCAGRQGKFWEMHDTLFAREPAGDDMTLRGTAAEAGLNLDGFRDCLVHGLVSGASGTVARDIEMGRLLSVRATPAFFVGEVSAEKELRITNRINGAQPLDMFAAVLDDLLSLAAGRDRAGPHSF